MDIEDVEARVKNNKWRATSTSRDMEMKVNLSSEAIYKLAEMKIYDKYKSYDDIFEKAIEAAWRRMQVEKKEKEIEYNATKNKKNIRR